MANLQPSGSRVPNAWSIKLTFSLTVTFYLTKTENRTKKWLKNSSHTIVLTKGTIFAKKCFAKKSADISKVNVVLVLQGIFSETTYVCTYAPNFKFLA